MQTALRYLMMLQHIPRQPQKIDPATLREKLYSQGFDVSVRTIQRDLNELSDVFPLVTDERSRPFGWSFLADSPMSLPSLDMPTALALLLMEQQLNLLLPSALLRKLRANFAAARKLLEDTASGYERWLERVHVVPRGVQLKPAEFKPAILDTIYQALEQNKQLTLSYRSRSRNQERVYSVSPMGVVHRGTVTYLVCQFDGHLDVRQLALQRILSIQVNNQPAKCPGDFDIKDYLQGGQLSLSSNGEKQTATFRFAGKVGHHLYETPLSEDQKIEVQGDHLQVTAKLHISDELVWWLLSFGAQVEVIAPTVLRDEVRAHVTVMKQLYEDG